MKTPVAFQVLSEHLRTGGDRCRWNAGRKVNGIWDLIISFCLNSALSLCKARAVQMDRTSVDRLPFACFPDQTNAPPREKQMLSLLQVQNSPCKYSLYASFFSSLGFNEFAITAIKVQIIHIIGFHSVQRGGSHRTSHRDRWKKSKQIPTQTCSSPPPGSQNWVSMEIPWSENRRLVTSKT